MQVNCHTKPFSCTSGGQPQSTSQCVCQSLVNCLSPFVVWLLIYPTALRYENAEFENNAYWWTHQISTVLSSHLLYKLLQRPGSLITSKCRHKYKKAWLASVYLLLLVCRAILYQCCKIRLLIKFSDRKSPQLLLLFLKRDWRKVCSEVKTIYIRIAQQ